MQTKFMLDGPNVSVIKFNEDFIVDDLPPKMYVVRFDPLNGYYLSIASDKLELPEKIYGNTPDRVTKCLDTYKQRDTSTGILLTGDKGTGKTLLMSLLANRVVEELKMPVILIRDAYEGTPFVTFIEAIGECALVFDEFGKMYAAGGNRSDSDVPQTSLLSLMDGVSKTKRMFILTENSELDINDFMLNRPSRIYYHFKYDKLDEGSILGYCQDYNVRSDVIKDIVDLARRSTIFSFDMLQSIVEEHLRFNCTVEEATNDLNIDTREVKGAMIEIIKIMERGTEVEREIFQTPFVSKPEGRGYNYIKVKRNLNARNGSNQEVAVPTTSGTVRARGAAELDCLDEDELYDEVYVESKDLAYEKEGKLVYETDKFIFVAKNVETQRTNYWNMF